MEFAVNSLTDINIAHHEIIISVIGNDSAFIITGTFFGNAVDIADNVGGIAAFEDRISFAPDAGDFNLFAGVLQFFDAPGRYFGYRGIEVSAKTAIGRKDQQKISPVIFRTGNHPWPFDESAVLLQRPELGNNILQRRKNVFAIRNAGSNQALSFTQTGSSNHLHCRSDFLC